jgi:molybdopterin molybdotransferase
MLTVKSLEEALNICKTEFGNSRTAAETVPLGAADGRVLHETIIADEYVPGFDRSTVDGIAVIAADTFGCSDNMPAQLTFKGEILMGQDCELAITPGECAGVSTGGKLPGGADAVVMVEYTEDFGDGFRYLAKPVSVRENVVLKGDDVSPGKLVLKQSTRLTPKEIGALAALGKTKISVYKKPVVGILSTGDEIVPIEQTPNGAQVRDVNTHLLLSAVRACGGEALSFGIVQDDEASLTAAVQAALPLCDVLLISGGSSAGEKDMTAKIIGTLGNVLVHGIAVKPGKPTIVGSVNDKPVIGLPGHPVSAYFIFYLLVRHVICSLNNTNPLLVTSRGVLGVNIPSNHGREEYMPVTRPRDGSSFLPVPVKSGLITLLSEADGFIRIDRDCEGLMKGDEVQVYLF